MKGFFTKQAVKSLKITSSKKLSCYACGLYRGVKSPKMEPYGKFKKEIMIIGEAPSEYDDRSGKPWQGKAGKLLEKSLAKVGIDLFKDCVSLNAINCQPPKNRTPSPNEIACCRDVKVLKAIHEYKPKLIILLGNVAVTSFIAHRWKKNLGGIMKWRGWEIPDQDYKCWVFPTLTPSYVGWADSKEVTTVWEKDLSKLLLLKDRTFQGHAKPNIKFIDDLNELSDFKQDMIAFDYETNSMKPQWRKIELSTQYPLGRDSEIVCASIAYDNNNVVAFLMPKKRSLREPFLKILRNPNIKKVAANLKFEDQWSHWRLKTDVQGWHWDTMLTSHILDNRRAINSLKFQAYVQFGIIDYGAEMVGEKDIGYYLSGPKGSKFNRIDELLEQPGGREQLLTYCALDSIYEYRLAKLQEQMIKI